MSVITRCSFAIALFLVCATESQAKRYQELFPDRVYQDAQVQALLESFNYQQGRVRIGTANVHLLVPSDFYFVGESESKRLLVELWGNPAKAVETVLGMILPSSHTPVDDTWGAVITFDADGYVSDEDAAKIDYNELLKSMQQSESEINRERVQQGFPAIHLVGWASPPFYDRATRKLHWAKELQFGDSDKHTLNYDVRVLGRHGVLKINFVSEMGQLAVIKPIIPVVMAMPEFESGSRYQDYIPSTDKVAAYGIGGLIAGKLLSKTGLLVVAVALLKKFWLLPILVLGGLLGGLTRLFGQPKS
jgi:uncharacterized membrane-anchored protein